MAKCPILREAEVLVCSDCGWYDHKKKECIVWTITGLLETIATLIEIFKEESVE